MITTHCMYYEIVRKHFTFKVLLVSQYHAYATLKPLGCANGLNAQTTKQMHFI